MFPLRGFVPVVMNGLLGAGKNIGVSSVVQSALRLHGQMMHAGQAAGTLAWLSLRDGVQPREAATDAAKVRELQRVLACGRGGPGVLLWPWQDVAPDDLYFEAVNMLSARGIWQPQAEDVFFHPGQTITRGELACLLARVCRSLKSAKDWPRTAQPIYQDVSAADPARPFIEAMVSWGDFAPLADQFRPDEIAKWSTLHQWLTRLHLPASNGLRDQPDLPLSRAEAAIQLWRVLQLGGEFFPAAMDDNGNNVPDHLEPL